MSWVNGNKGGDWSSLGEGTPLSEEMVELSGVHLGLLNLTFRIKLMKIASFCSQDRIIGHPRNPYTPVARKDNKSASVLSKPGSSALAQYDRDGADLRTLYTE